CKTTSDVIELKGALAKERALWQSQSGPGSLAADLETTQGRLLASRRDLVSRSLASSMSAPFLDDPRGRSSGSLGTAFKAELALRDHEISARQWRAVRGPS
ncbi:unnamed protein product, partial [Polarella glacialis]